MKDIITNLKVYDFEETMVASGYAMIEEYEEDKIIGECDLVGWDLHNKNESNRHYKRALRLTKAPLNSGHPNFMSGILVSMDVTFTNKVYVEWERYHFQQIVTSQSTMHRLAKMNLDEVFIEYVDPTIINQLKILQKEYNENLTRENFLKLVYSCPSGLRLTARVATNYLQLATMYKQRRNHRLPEWQKFCQELVEKLPLFYEFLETSGSLYKDDIRG